MIIKRLEKRAQLTIFVILGILIVVGIITIFLMAPDPQLAKGSKKSPTEEIKSCISESLENVLPEYFRGGFYFNPQASNYLNYSDGGNQAFAVAYHCYTDQKKSNCVRSSATSKSRIEKELEDKIRDDVERCFLDFKKNNRGMDITINEGSYSIEILPEKISMRTRRVVSVSIEGEEPTNYENFDSYIISPLWDYISLSNEIINHEVSCDCLRGSCIPDVTEIMRDNRDYKITFFQGSRGERVYTFEEYKSDAIKFHFAVKNCVKI